MSTASISHFPFPAWVSQARFWFAQRARLRADSEAVSRMEPRELQDLGFSHSAAARGEIELSEQGRSDQANWIHAAPRFRGRAARQD
jgi:hypothetical protein